MEDDNEKISFANNNAYGNDDNDMGMNNNYQGGLDNEDQFPNDNDEM